MSLPYCEDLVAAVVRDGEQEGVTVDVKVLRNEDCTAVVDITPPIPTAPVVLLAAVGCRFTEPGTQKIPSFDRVIAETIRKVPVVSKKAAAVAESSTQLICHSRLCMAEKIVRGNKWYIWKITVSKTNKYQFLTKFVSATTNSLIMDSYRAVKNND